MMLMSVGIASISSAVVDLAQTGVDHTGGYVYFLKPSTWTASYVMMFIGHDSYTSVYEMTKVSNTDNLYRYSMPSWGGATYVAFANASSLWGSGSWGPSNRTNATHYTNVYNNYRFDSGSYYVCVPASSSNNAGISINYKGSASDLNLSATANVYSADAGSTSFGSNAAAGTVSISGRYMSAYNTASSRSAVSSTASSASASTTLAPGSTATFSATAKDGYEFVGWSTSNSEAGIVSTSATYSYKYDISYAGKTMYALFRKAASEVTATFMNKDGNTIGTPQTITSGGTPTAPTAPTVAGHTFTGWLSSADSKVYASNSLPAITDDTTFTAQYSKNSYTVTATAATGGTVTGGGSYEYESVATLTAEATLDGYVFTGWTLSGGYQITEGSNTSATIKIKVTGAVTATANFQQIPTNSVSVTANPPEAGTVSPVQQDVAEGSKVDLTAVPNKGYTFTGWSITGSYTIHSGTVNSQAFSIIPQAEITAQANFRANTATVTVNAQSGGSVTNAGANATAYPDTVTSTAAENTGYTFAGWTITGTLGTDYELVNCSASDKTITIRPIKDGASITATAKFLLGQYLTVYTFSEDGYDKLTVTESNGTTTNTVVDALPQPDTATFGIETWDASAQMQLTNGYSSSVTAQLSGESTSGTVIYVDFSNAGSNWGSGHYLSVTSSTNSGKRMDKEDTSGAGSYTPQNDAWLGAGTLVSGSTYMWTIPDANLSNLTNYGFTVWSVNESSYGQVWQTDVSHVAYSATYNTYTIGSDKTTHNDRQSDCFTLTASSNTSQSTGDIDLTSTLYTDGTWANVDRVWIYQSGSTEIVTLRSELLEAIADSESTFTAGNDGIWTDESWSEFVTAYNTAVSTVGAGASIQVAINAAAADLIAKKAALATQEKVSLSVTQQGATGTVSFGNVTVDTATWTGDVNKGKPVTLNITAPNMYYISAVIVNSNTIYLNSDADESVLTKQIVTAPLSLDPSSIVVQYTARTTYTITVDTYPTLGGNLYFNGELIPAAGKVYTVCSGDNVTITADPADGYGVYYWIIDSQSGHRELTHNFGEVSKNHTIDVEWLELEEVTVSVVNKPAAAGNSTANGETTVTVEQYSTVELITVNNDPRYMFVGWAIEGAYSNADNTTKNDMTYRIVANGGNIKATARYDKVLKAIYLDNAAGWQQPHIYSWGSSSHVTAWPGDEMTYDSTLGWWVGYVPLDATNVQFNDGTNQNQREFEIGTDNLFTNGTDTTNYPTSYVEPGYYLQGTWNGSSHSAYSNVKFEQQADNTYTLELTVTKTADGYIYVNPTNEKSHFWNAATNGATGNPQTLTATGAYQSSPKQVKIEIDTTDFNKAYDLLITFNPRTGAFSWTKAENVPTITINGSDGRITNEADSNMVTPNNRVGDTFFDLDTVNRVNSHTYYDSAQVVAGTPVTFSTQVNPNGSGGYDYYVAGWVINGTDFVSATTMGSGLYTGSYVFADDANIIPVYFHTNEWLSANNVKTVTVYAVNNNNSITNWDDYMAAYTWYKVSGVTQYAQFGKYTGQVMIPVTGLDGVYYTYIETTSPEGVDISGITFNNHGDADNGYDVSHEVNYSHIQTYDYYEFMALLEDGKENITFVLKNTNDTYNASRVDGSAEDIANGNWDFVQYTDYSGLKTDIFGNDIEDIDSTLSDSNALYVIQAGDKNYSGVGNLDGQWYVDCYLYDATGKYLGKCYSYELHDEDSAIWTTLAAYEGQRAYISYEHVNGSRYDGEWYGDANVSVTINLSVNVGLTTDGGKTYTINETSPVNVADYGTGYINVQYQNVDVTRGDTVTLTAMPKTGYKFVGWYSADGTCFTTNTTFTVTAAIGTTYTAVFDALDTGYFYVNHYIYQGIGTSTNYIPVPNGGNALLYVGIKNIKTGVESGFSQTNTAYVKAQEGDELLITVATDAIGADEFYAWYVDAVDSTGTTFEEVGVDTDDNLAMSDENNPYYMSGVNTVVGAKDRVYFSFKYTVKDFDSFSMNIYSDLIHVSIDRILVYNYNDRYGNVKSYYVPYTLNQQEIEGFAGNGFAPMKPAYISSPTGEWENTVLVNAPYVNDYYKDATWIINQTMFDTQTISLWATHNYPTYTVTYTVDDTVLVQKVPYNSLVEIDARDHSATARNAGFWYEEIIKNGVYDKGVDIILCYGATYMYRVTKDMVINYQAVEEFDFNIMIDAPVYGREQTTDTQGNNKKDTIYIDYLNNILTPYMYGDTDKVTGEVYDTVHFGGETLDEFWGADHVTVESLIAMGYELEYGMILEWVGAGLITETNTLEMAQKKAESNGYGTATDEETLKNVIKNYNGTPNMANGGKYYTLLSVNNPTLTNKNRYLFTMTMSNTENNQGKFYNVYGYLKVKAPGSDTWSYYTSNVQTLNIYECGTTEATTEDNTTFN